MLNFKGVVLIVALTSKDFQISKHFSITLAHLELEFVEAQAPSAVVEWGGVFSEM